ncbi:MAG: cyclase family protein [Candidatus Competibacteraceae bacterium]|nr:cyclase family protein [Candidatus Competibacteraceae bacterium]MBK7984774.1 cyclase family protein [Candidatus Competibacteraceae bacterium]MBK8899460.1 cyclase family protein [Candidatus Competibacteraceae bacterium]MBK8964464.1 cyclase family protein [Candidatus Competibacteraceae bacterium]MBK9952454.1 cyclase family protein [Candidatus Competibacteraceae bacterium]
MTQYFDISLTISSELPRWPGSPPVEFTRRRDMARGDPVNDGALSFGVHTGTHVDAPVHFLANGTDVTQLALDALLGPAVVAALPGVDAVSARDLEALDLPADTQRLLLRTRNSEGWRQGEREFRKDFVALTADAARWVVARGLRLIGVDYLSVQRFHDGPDTHIALLEADVVILEGLNLAEIEPGPYELIALPLKLAGGDGAPARAVLKSLAG